jgi:hypothetical protein
MRFVLRPITSFLAAHIPEIPTMKNLVLALMAATAVAAAPAAEQPPLAACPANAIITAMGSGGATSRPFYADGPFEVQWSLTDAPLTFMVWLNTKAGQFKVLMANQMSSDPGSAYYQKSGDCYLTVNTAFANRVTGAVHVPAP